MLKNICVLLFLSLCTSCHAQYQLVIDSLYSEVEKVKEEVSKAEIYKKMIYALVNDDWKLQNKILAEAEPILKKYPDIYQDCLFAIAWSGVIVGEFDKVDSIYSVLQHSCKDKPLKQKFLYSEIALYKYSILELREADSLMQLSFTEDIPITEDTAFFYQHLNGTYNTRAMIKLAQGQFKEAEKNLAISLRYADLRNNNGARDVAYANLFSTNLSRGNINQSIKYLKKSFNFYLKNKRSKVTDIETFLTLLYLYTDLGLEGLEEELLFEKAQLLVDETKAVNMRVELDLIRLKKLLSKKDTVRSFQVIKDLEKFTKNIDAKLYFPDFYDAQIKYFLLVNNKEKVQLLVDELYNLCLKQDIKYHEALCLYYYSEIEREEDLSINLLEQSYALADSCDNIKLKARCLEKLAAKYTSKEDFKKATQAYEEISILNDSLNVKEEGLNTLTELFNNVQSYLDIGSKKIKIYKKAPSNNNTTLAAIFLFLVSGFFVLIGFAVKNNKNKNQAEQQKQLQLKEQRLKEQELKQEIRQQELRESILDNVQKTYLTHQKSVEIEKLKQRLVNSEIEWSQFLLEYEVLSPDFLQKCKKLDVKLTNNTLRHLLCIRMYLSIKETAALNGVSLDAVKKARYRLKKQLKLQPEASLINYITNL